MPFVSTIRKNHETKVSPLDHFEITGGDEIYTAGGYRIHVFTQTGESELSIAARSDHNNLSLLPTNLAVEYLVIAGGGAGATNLAGGGGAGGYREGNLVVPVGNQSVNVGGGSGPSAPGSRYAKGSNGGPSTFASITSTGGGGGGEYSGGAGRPGGSGGGGGGGPSHHAGGGGGGAGGFGYRGYQPGPNGGSAGSGIVGQGHPGGPGGGNISDAGQGGTGLASSITGTSVLRAGGGGGSSYPSAVGPRGHKGGAGGGGDGRARAPRQNGGVGATNTGSGGGSGSYYGEYGGGGGPGIVIVRYPT